VSQPDWRSVMPPETRLKGRMFLRSPIATAMPGWRYTSPDMAGSPPGKSLPGAKQAEPEQIRALPTGPVNLESDDDICFDDLADFDECSDTGESQANIELNPNANGGVPLIGLWPWLLAVLAGLTVAGGTGF